MIHRVIVFVAALLLAVGMAHAQPGGDDVTGMLQEIQKLSDEKKANEAKMQINLSPLETERESQRLAGRKRALEAEQRQVSAAYDDLCSRASCSGDKYGWSTFGVDCHHDPACEAAMAAYLPKVENFRAHVRSYNAENTTLTNRKQAYQALFNRNSMLDSKISELRRRIVDTNAVAVGRLRQTCIASAAGNPDDDAAVQDMSHCFDEALKSNQLVTVEQQTGRYWPSKRARELAAIAEYLNSGRIRPGPVSFQPVSVPEPAKPGKKD